MASVLEDLVVRISADTRALTAGLNRATTAVSRTAQATATATATMTRSLTALGTSTGALLGAGGLVFAMTNAARSASEAEVAVRLFEKQLQRTGQSVTQGSGQLDQLASRLRVTSDSIADNVTQLLRQGLTMQEISQLLTGAAASALAAGRTTSQGIEGVTQAVVNQQSIFLNQVGIAENLNVAYRDFARSVGKSTDDLSKQERAQAALQLVLRATREEVNDLDTLFNSLGGESASLSTQLNQVKLTFGSIINEALVPMVRGLTSVVESFNNLDPTLQRAILQAGAAASALTVLATAGGLLVAAMGPLIGPAGVLVLAAAAAGALSAVLGDNLGGAIRQVNPALDTFKERTNLAMEELARVETVDQLEAALTTLGDTLDGPAKTAWDNYSAKVLEAKDNIEDVKKAAEEAAARFLELQILPNVQPAFESLVGLPGGNQAIQGITGALRSRDPGQVLGAARQGALVVEQAANQGLIRGRELDDARAAIATLLAGAQTWGSLVETLEATSNRLKSTQEGNTDETERNTEATKASTRAKQEEELDLTAAFRAAGFAQGGAGLARVQLPGGELSGGLRTIPAPIPGVSAGEARSIVPAGQPTAQVAGRDISTITPAVTAGIQPGILAPVAVPEVNVEVAREGIAIEIPEPAIEAIAGKLVDITFGGLTPTAAVAPGVAISTITPAVGAQVGPEIPIGGFTPEIGVSVGGPPVDIASAVSQAAEESERASSEAALEQLDAARQFKESVVAAGAEFAVGIVAALQEGDIQGVFQSLTNLGQDLFSSLGQNVGQLTGGLASIGSLAAGPFAPLVSAGIGIFGSLIGGLFGREDRREQEDLEARTRPVSSLEISVTFNQSNTFDTGITDPVTLVALREQFQVFIEEWEASRGFVQIQNRVLGAST